MSDSREDIRNLFQSRGLSGGYREFGERPAQPRSQSADKAAEQQPEPQAPEEKKARQAPRLDVVGGAEYAAKSSEALDRPLASLFQRLALTSGRGGGDGASGKTSEELMQMPLEALFEHLGDQGKRR